jgi:hypothetical protein
LRRYPRKRASPRLVESGTRQATASLQVDTRMDAGIRGKTCCRRSLTITLTPDQSGRR